jgi:hypothetical protein
VHAAASASEHVVSSAVRLDQQPELEHQRLQVVPMGLLRVLWFIVRTALGTFGCAVRLLDYRKVDEGVYDATNWVTLFFFPIVPLRTLRIRPRTAEVLNLGAAVVSRYNFDLLAESSTPPARIARMYVFAWVLVPVVMAGPGAGAVVFAKTHDGGAPSPLKTALLLAAVVWGVVVVGLLNHRREKLYDWGDSAGAAAARTRPQ